VFDFTLPLFITVGSTTWITQLKVTYVVERYIYRHAEEKARPWPP